MILINRKKILFWIGIIATLRFIYSITADNVNNTKNNFSNDQNQDNFIVLLIFFDSDRKKVKVF